METSKCQQKLVVNIMRKEASGYWVVFSGKGTIKTGKQQDIYKEGINKY